MFLLRKKFEKIDIFHRFLHIFRNFRKIEKFLQVQNFFAFFPGDHGAIMGRSWGASAPWGDMVGIERRNAKNGRIRSEKRENEAPNDDNPQGMHDNRLTIG